MIVCKHFYLALGVIVACWVPAYAQQQNAVPLFNGRDLDGWTPMGVRGGQSGGDWVVRNRELICDGANSSWLRSDQKYADFVLELEFKIPGRANSGILVRCPDRGPSGLDDGMEIQLLGTAYSADSKIAPTKQTGAIYDVVPPTSKVQRSSNEWNTMSVRCEGDDIEVRMNGTLIVQANMQRRAELRHRHRSGFIGFYNWSGQGRGTAFRNIRIRQLGATSRPTATRSSSPPPEPAPLPNPMPDARYLELQVGNTLPNVRIQPKHPRELANNRIGAQYVYRRNEQVALRFEYEHAIRLGLKWVRLSLDPIDGPRAMDMKRYSKFDVSPPLDETVTLFADSKIAVMCCIVYWDETLQERRGGPTYRKEREIQRYLDYVRFVVRHFRGRIRYYEVLNESGAVVELADYLNLVRRAIPVIRREDPEARIVAGAVATLLQPHCRRRLLGILSSNVVPLVDGVSFHPNYGASPQYAGTREYYYGYPSLLRKTKAVGSAHRFRGEYFAEEMKWRLSINPHPHETWQYTQNVAAKYYARGIVMHLGMDVWAGAPAGHSPDLPQYRVVQNLCTVMAGNKPLNRYVQIQSKADRIRSYTFSLPNGDRLVALWDDNTAVDDDRGEPSAVTVKGFSARKATAIDVLYSSEQQMITETEGGDLVIRNLLVKDYPIILRLTP